MKIENIPKNVLVSFRNGTVIPAQPLALDCKRNFDPLHQRALTRYYIDSGVGGIAVGVHSTQFEIRDPDIGLFKPVLSGTSTFIDEWTTKRQKRILKIAGVCGLTDQAIAEANFAIKNGYHAVLLSLAALKKEKPEELIDHCRKVAAIVPIIGFYLQPSVGGRILPYSFWREFVEIKNVLGIKIAAFNRYQTFDVVRAVCEAGKENEITLYTGNDDNIVYDLISEYRIQTKHEEKTVRFKGGLLGHWCVWTKKAVELLDEIHEILYNRRSIPNELLTRGIEITDSNAAFFDPANAFAGCIPGIHEVLRRQGLLQGIWCLNPEEVLSKRQVEEIDRVYCAYPHLNDDEFVREHLNEWLQD